MTLYEDCQSPEGVGGEKTTSVCWGRRERRRRWVWLRRSRGHSTSELANHKPRNVFGSGWEGQGEPITDQRGEPEAKRGRSLLVKGVGLNQKGDASCLMLFLSVTLSALQWSWIWVLQAAFNVQYESLKYARIQEHFHFVVEYRSI